MFHQVVQGMNAGHPENTIRFDEHGLVVTDRNHIAELSFVAAQQGIQPAFESRGPEHRITDGILIDQVPGRGNNRT